MTFSLTVQKRTPKQPEIDRANNLIPAVLYGPEIAPVAISVDRTTFLKMYTEAGEATLIDLAVGGEPSAKVLIQAVQHDPVKGTITHVDFRQINMKKEMTATLELNFLHEPPAVKELGGTLMRPLTTLAVKCLPKDLVSTVDVDLSVLKTFNDVIRVSDLILPPGITAEEDAETTIAKVSPPLSEDEIKAMDEAAAPSVADIEISVEKGKKEEEAAEGEDGAAPAPDKKADKK